MSGLNSFQDSLNSIKQLFERKNGRSATANELINYAHRLENQDGVNLFDVWDNAYDGDSNSANSITDNRLLASGNKLLFQTDNNQFILYDVQSGNAKIATDEEVASIGDNLDDGDATNSSFTVETVRSGIVKLGSNIMKLVKVNDDKTIVAPVANSTSSDDNTASLQMTSSEVSGLLQQLSNLKDGLGNKLASSVNDLISILHNPADPNYTLATTQLKGLIREFLTTKYALAGDSASTKADKVLKALTGLDVTSTTSSYLNETRQSALDAIIDQFSTEVIAASVVETAHDSAAFNEDAIHNVSANFNLGDGKPLIATQIDTTNEAFKTKYGVQAGDTVTVDPTTAAVSIKRTNNGTVNGTPLAPADIQVTISAADMKAILEKMASGKTATTALQEQFGNTDAILTRFGLSTSGTQAAKDAAVALVAAQFAGKVASGSVTGSQSGASLTNYYDVQFAKTDFTQIDKDIIFSNTSSDAFKDYVQTTYGITIQAGDVVTVNQTSDPPVSIKRTNNGTVNGIALDPADTQVTIAASDIKAILEKMAAGQSASDAVQAQFGDTDAILTKFGLSTSGTQAAKDAAVALVIAQFAGKIDSGFTTSSPKPGASLTTYYDVQFAKTDFTQIGKDIIFSDITSDAFKDYVQTNYGITIQPGDVVTVNQTSVPPVSVSRTSVNANTTKPGVTAPATNAGQVTISAADMKTIQDKIDTGMPATQAVTEYLVNADAALPRFGLAVLATTKAAVFASLVGLIVDNLSSGSDESTPQAGLSVKNYYDVKLPKLWESNGGTGSTYNDNGYGNIDWNGDGNFSNGKDWYDNFIVRHGTMDSVGLFLSGLKAYIDAHADDNGNATYSGLNFKKTSETQYGFSVPATAQSTSTGAPQYNYVVYDTEKNTFTVGNDTNGDGKLEGAEIQGVVVNVGAGSKTASPLVLDLDGDGVEATQGMGVDINGDGVADGAATGGDGMLAMGDLDGDGIITGKEVFGDQTVDPFTGIKLNAANGFEALRMVAESVERNTGVKCIFNGKVDLKKMKEALELSGKGSLGMISGNNVTNLEGLGNVASIDVSNYTQHQDTGKVQHNQQGLFTTTDGTEHKVDDVWFELG